MIRSSVFPSQIFLSVLPAALVAAVLLSAPAAARAAEAPAPAASPGAAGAATEERLRALEARLEALARELAEARASGAVAPGRLEELERKVDLLTRELEKARLGEAAADSPLASKYGLGPAASKVYAKDRGASLGGYGQLEYSHPDSRRDDGSPSDEQASADAERFVLYVGYKWTDRVILNTEIEFEHATTGEGDEEKGEVSVEFAQIDFLLHEKANVRAGLLLMPVGFLNELHEPTTFFGVHRPAVEDLIIPSTWREIGAGAFGDCGPVSWRAYVVNGLNASEFSAGEGWHEGRGGGSNAAAEDLAVTARADWTIVAGLTVGGSVYAGGAGQGAEDTAGRSVDSRARLVEAHAQGRWRGLSVRALAARTRLTDVSRLNDSIGLTGDESIGERMRGYYAEAAFDLLTLRESSKQSLAPFLRYESFDTQSRVPSGFGRNPENNGVLWTVGVAWKPIPQVVVTLDHENGDNAAGTGTDRTNLGLGFIF